MLPRMHVLYGAIFTLIFWLIFPETKFLYLSLIFCSSFLIDIDHYLYAVFETKKISLKNALMYYKEIILRTSKERKNGIRKKGNFHLFHTIEFHILIGILGIFFPIFIYIFIGMIFHSFLDLFDMINRDYLYHREFFFFNWLKNKL